METISFAKARAEFAALLDKVNDGAAPIEIRRHNKSSAVLMSKDEYESMVETLHLLSTSANATRLYQAKADIEAARYVLSVIPGVNDQ